MSDQYQPGDDYSNNDPSAMTAMVNPNAPPRQGIPDGSNPAAGQGGLGSAPPMGIQENDVGAPVVGEQGMGQAPVPSAVGGLNQMGAAQVQGAAGQNSPQAALGAEPMGEHAGAVQGINDAGASQVAQSAGLAGAAPGGAGAGPASPTKRIASMVMGEGAAPLPVLRQSAQAVDPHNSQPPGNQNMMAVDAALQKGDMKGAQALMQANRVAWGSQQGFALSAMNGVQGKPPDLNAAINAANLAEQHVLDGSNVKFSHAGDGGVTATVTMATGGEPQIIKLSTDQFKQFLNIGDNHWDKLMNRTVPATLQMLSNGQMSMGGPAPKTGEDNPRMNVGARRADADADAGPKRAPEFGDPGVDAPFKGKFDANGHYMGPEDGTYNKAGKYTGGGATPERGGTPQVDARGHATALDNPNYSGEQGQSFQDKYGKERTTFDPKTDDEMLYRANRMFPGMGMEKEKQEWISAQQEKDAERKNRLDVRTQQGENALKVAQETGAHRDKQVHETVAGKLQDTETKTGGYDRRTQSTERNNERNAASKAAHDEATNTLKMAARNAINVGNADRAVLSHWNKREETAITKPFTPEEEQQYSEDMERIRDRSKGTAPAPGTAVPTGKAAPPPSGQPQHPTGQGAASPVSKADLEAEMRRRGHLQ